MIFLCKFFTSFLRSHFFCLKTFAQTINKCFRHLSNVSDIYQILPIANLCTDFQACSGTYEWKYQITMIGYGCPDVQYGTIAVRVGRHGAVTIKLGSAKKVHCWPSVENGNQVFREDHCKNKIFRDYCRSQASKYSLMCSTQSLKCFFRVYICYGTHSVQHTFSVL